MCRINLTSLTYQAQNPQLKKSAKVFGCLKSNDIFSKIKKIVLFKKLKAIINQVYIPISYDFCPTSRQITTAASVELLGLGVE